MSIITVLGEAANTAARIASAAGPGEVLVSDDTSRVALCRCGVSSNKPFCDGSHATAHFDER
jgi:CDGSH-type Zn-finger protein